MYTLGSYTKDREEPEMSKEQSSITLNSGNAVYQWYLNKTEKNQNKRLKSTQNLTLYLSMFVKLSGKMYRKRERLSTGEND